MSEEIKELLIKQISKLDFVSLMKCLGHKFICIECKNYKWITNEESEFNWGWRCIKDQKLSYGNCRGKLFIPKDSFIKEIEGKQP